MSNLNLNTLTTTSTIYPIFGGSTVNYQTSEVDDPVVEYIDFAFQVMGIDLNFEDFKNMSLEERKALLREIKINKIV